MFAFKWEETVKCPPTNKSPLFLHNKKYRGVWLLGLVPQFSSIRGQALLSLGFPLEHKKSMEVTHICSIEEGAGREKNGSSAIYVMSSSLHNKSESFPNTHPVLFCHVSLALIVLMVESSMVEWRLEVDRNRSWVSQTMLPKMLLKDLRKGKRQGNIHSRRKNCK